VSLGQPLQSPPSSPVKPALHEQLVTSVAASGPLACAGHVSHPAVPVVFLYVPAAHGSHGPPLGPVNPALQWQSVISSAPGGDDALFGHNAHAALLESDLKVPAGHATASNCGSGSLCRVWLPASSADAMLLLMSSMRPW
jgi:hypothetical protein